MDAESIFQANRRSTDRMQTLIQGLSEKELTQTSGDNWPIYVMLAHLAFWDQRVVHVIELARKNNVLVVPHFDDQLNDILAPFLGAISPGEAVEMTIRIARTLDQYLEECPPELFNQMMEVNNRLVERSLHRNDHLDDIEKMINQ
jgi:hypothetical protein